MTALVFFLFLIQFPRDCGCFQIPPDPDGDLFAAALRVRLFLDDDQATTDNSGIYVVRWVGIWPLTGIRVVFVSPEPPQPDQWARFYRVVFDEPEVFRDGFESGGFGFWGRTIGGSP